MSSKKWNQVIDNVQDQLRDAAQGHQLVGRLLFQEREELAQHRQPLLHKNLARGDGEDHHQQL